jgi:MarR family transcriptional regulator, organic hydroperoxide resistance regulator
MELKETVDFHIKSAWHALTRMYNNIANKHGISQTIGYVLINVAKEGTPATKIAPLMGMEPTSLSRLLKNMEKKGLIYRKGDEEDKRVVRIFLTEEGVAKRKLAKQTILNFNEKLMKKLKAQDLDQMVKAFNIIKQCVQEEMDEMGIDE